MTERENDMHHPFVVGETVYLRPLEPGDLDGPYLRWLNDSEVTRNLETGAFPTTKATLERYVNAVAKIPDHVMLAIIDRDSESHIGNIKLGPIHWIHRRADLGVLVGEQRFQGRGVGRQAVGLMLEYGFLRLNLHKITLGAFADHHPAVGLYEKLGFKIEGTLREQLFREGAYHDSLIMGIIRSDWEACHPAMTT